MCWCRLRRAPKHCNLLVLDAGGFGQSVHDEIGKVFAQHLRARSQLWLRNDEHKNAAGLQPAIGVLQKHQL